MKFLEVKKQLLNTILIFLIIGSVLGASHGEANAEERTETSWELQALTEESFADALKSGGKFAVYVAVAHCAATPSYIEIVKEHVRAMGAQEQVYYLGVSRREDLELARAVIPRIKDYQAPSQIIAFEGGRFIDWTVATSDEEAGKIELQSFFSRNGFGAGESSYVHDFSKGEMATEEIYGVIQTGAAAVNLSGQVLDGLDLSSITFGGARLVNVSFKDTDLSGSSFAYADLRGAKLEGANLENVHWHQTICPDGTKSAENNGTCEGHLVK